MFVPSLTTIKGSGAERRDRAPALRQKNVMVQSLNRLLASLPADVFSMLQPHLQPAELIFGDVLADTGQAITHVYFPHSGIISLVVDLSVGFMIETAMIGHDGAFNAAPALDGKCRLTRLLCNSRAKRP